MRFAADNFNRPEHTTGVELSSFGGMMEGFQLYGLLSGAFGYIVIFALSWAFYKLFIYRHVTPLRKIPARPVMNPFLGNMGEIFREEAIDPYERWVNEMNTGILRYTHILGEQRVLIADADAMKHIMVTNVKNYPKPEFLFRLFTKVTGKGLVSLNGEEHMTQRKLCLGAFKTAVLKNMIPTFQRHAETLIKLWNGQLQKDKETELDIHDDLHRMAMDIISESGFGYDTNALMKPDQPETKAFAYMLGGLKPSILRIILPSFSDLLPTQENRIFAENLNKSDTLINNVVNHKKSAIEKDESKCSDVLSLLVLAKDVESGLGLSNKQLRDHVMTFMLAGHETTSTGMCWCLLTLAQKQDIQKRVRDEVLSVLPPAGQPITFEDMEKMTFLTCVVKETLRLYPPAPMTFRSAANDDTINGYFIPKGTTLNIHVGAMHRNPKYWKNPKEFQPERFLDEGSIHPYAFLPFVAGPRMCIGYKFAMLEMKVVLAMLLRGFVFHPIPDQTYKKQQRITMKPEPSLKLKAEFA